MKGRYHINDIKSFLPRTEFDRCDDFWKSTAEINKEIKRKVNKWMADRSKARKKAAVLHRG